VGKGSDHEEGAGAVAGVAPPQIAAAAEAAAGLVVGEAGVQLSQQQLQRGAILQEKSQPALPVPVQPSSQAENDYRSTTVP
jgi:hypothetical protein